MGIKYTIPGVFYVRLLMENPTIVKRNQPSTCYGPLKGAIVQTLFKHYKWDFLATALAVIGTFYFLGWLSAFQLAILVVLEITFSFDNAVVNATILKNMSPKWQLIFMTVGIPIAVVGMRFLFPIVIVMLSAQMGFGDVWNLALHDPHLYAEKLEVAHPAIAIFGGVFLLLIFLNFILEERKVQWVPWIERPLSRVGKAGKLDVAALFIATAVVYIVAVTAPSHEEKQIFAWGVASILLYVVVSFLSSVFEGEEEDGEDEDDTETEFTLEEDDNTPKKTGWPAFWAFMYLEVQDAAFSFDGVSGAFAISDMIILIALGLGIGALFVRSMTVHLVRSGTLAKYRYLEHGAHYAIGTLAACMILSIHLEVPDWVTGLIGVFFIALALRASKKFNTQVEQRKQAEEDRSYTDYVFEKHGCTSSTREDTFRALGATALKGAGVQGGSDDSPHENGSYGPPENH